MVLREGLRDKAIRRKRTEGNEANSHVDICGNSVKTERTASANALRSVCSVYSGTKKIILGWGWSGGRDRGKTI